MVRVRGPLGSITASGWLDKYFYRSYGIVRNPYPIGLLGHIHVPYSNWITGINGFYSIPAFALSPYSRFIAQYYSVKGWAYTMRRTWHGIDCVPIRAPTSNAPSKPDELKGQVVFQEAIELWQSMNQETKDIYKNWRTLDHASGYNKFISWYLKTTPSMPIYWGTLQRSLTDNRTIEQKMVDQDTPEIRYPFNFKQYQLFNMVMHKGPGFPENPTDGQLFYDTSDGNVYYFKTNSWVQLNPSVTYDTLNLFKYRKLNSYHTAPSNSIALAAGTLASGIFYTIPFYTAVEMTLSLIAIYSTNATSRNIRLGIYADNGDCTPGALILDTGDIACARIGLIGKAINQVLAKDTLYWLAFAQSTMTTVHTLTAANSALPINGINPTSPTTFRTYPTQFGAYGALPDPFSLTAYTSEGPAILVKKSA